MMYRHFLQNTHSLHTVQAAMMAVAVAGMTQQTVTAAAV
jgi:hypothetical protein